jgi:hypothetical protein
MAANNLDYRRDPGPSVKGPGLLLWSNEGKAIRNLEGVGTWGWLSGPHRGLLIEEKRVCLVAVRPLRPFLRGAGLLPHID